MARTPKPNDGKSGRISVNLEGFKKDDERPEIQVSGWDKSGEKIFSVNADPDGSIAFPAEVLRKAQTIRVGASDEDADGNTDSALIYRSDQFADVVKAGTLNVSSAIWKNWFVLLRCVSGKVRACRRGRWWYNDLISLAAAPRMQVATPVSPSITRRAALCTPEPETAFDLATASQPAGRISPVSSIDDLIAWPVRCFPVCRGTVDVYRRTCCCDRWIVYDPRIPELIKELEDIVRVIPIPDPDPVFGAGPMPIPPGPDPVAMTDNVLINEGTLNEKAIHAAQDLNALRSISAEQIPAYINARPHLFCRGYSCSAPVKVASGNFGPDGKFNVCWRDFPHILRHGCHHEYSYVVKQPYGPFMMTIYNGPSANRWYHAGDNPTLTSYHPFAYGCRHNPTGAFVFLDLIGDTGAQELITPDADAADSVAAPAYNSGLVFPAPNPAAAIGSNLNRNWGGTLKLSYMFSEGMQNIGAKYYRVSVVEADDNGNPTGTRHYYDAGLSWNKAVPDGGGGVDIIPVSLGPTSAGAGADTQNFLYEIPYDTNPTTDWNAGQYHAHLNTNDSRWSDPTRRHLIMTEVFDENGRRLRPNGTPATGLGGQEATAAFTYRRRYQATGATANVPFGALSHMFWWDNRDVFADILDLRRDGLVFNAECLFFGGSNNTTFSVGYRAYHPNEMFQYYHNITWRRGLGSTAASSGTLQPVNSNNVGLPPAAPGGSATNTFFQMLRPDLDPDRTKCAFTAFLNIWNKRTDGDDLGHQYRGDTAAFVVEIDS